MLQDLEMPGWNVALNYIAWKLVRLIRPLSFMAKFDILAILPFFVDFLNDLFQVNHKPFDLMSD